MSKRLVVIRAVLLTVSLAAIANLPCSSAAWGQLAPQEGETETDAEAVEEEGTPDEAQDEASSTVEQQTPEVVVAGLTNPTAIAIHPTNSEVYVSDSGAGRVCRVVDGQLQDVVTGFALDLYGKGPAYKIGPLGLTFADPQTLIVGGGDLPDGQELVREYGVTAAGAAAVGVDEAAAKIGPLAGEGDVPAEGNFFGVAFQNDTVYVTSNGDDAKGWIAKATRTVDAKTNKVQWSALERFIPTKEVVQCDAPVAITISPRGEIVVGQMGELTETADSLLSFYGPRTGRLLLNLPTDLRDVTALAYSPKTGLLYALDFAWAQPDQGGLYRLDAVPVAGKQQCKATKIQSLTRPTAMAFNKAGDLYITVLGATEQEAEAAGSLLRLPAGL